MKQGFQSSRVPSLELVIKVNINVKSVCVHVGEGGLNVRN